MCQMMLGHSTVSYNGAIAKIVIFSENFWQLRASIAGQIRIPSQHCCTFRFSRQMLVTLLHNLCFTSIAARHCCKVWFYVMRSGESAVLDTNDVFLPLSLINRAWPTGSIIIAAAVASSCSCRTTDDCGNNPSDRQYISSLKITGAGDWERTVTMLRLTTANTTTTPHPSTAAVNLLTVNRDR